MVTESFKNYNDAAIVVFSRTGGEGSDASRVTSEKATEADKENHIALYTDEEGNAYKHYLMLTESERQLINLVTENFKKVIVVLNTSNVMEVAELQNNPKISAIIDIDRPGMGGLNGLAEILNGTVNPSGAVIDEWMTDLTGDPTWYNFGSNNQTKGLDGVGVGDTTYLYPDGTPTGTEGTSTAYDSEGYHGVDYEEGIYLGYRYYETYYYDKYDADKNGAQEWWAQNVTYPFGYGLSYTTFSFKAGGLFTDEACKNALGASVSADKFNSSLDNPAEIEKLYVPVTVKNTGDVAGKKIVQVYVTAPYTKGGIEKAAVSLVGYAKTDILAPGASQTVVVSFNVQDMASWDYNDANKDGSQGDYEMDPGKYVIRVMENSHFDRNTNVADANDAYDEVSFTLNGTVHQSIDDFSHLELKNLFSAENGTWDETTKDHDLRYNDVREASMMADGVSGMTVISRADMDGTFPKAPTAADVTFRENVLSNWAYWDNFRVTNLPELDDNDVPIAGSNNWDASFDEPTDPWYKSKEDIPANWTQAAGTYDENHLVEYNRAQKKFPMYVSSAAESPIKFADMAGVAFDDPKWDEFLNQLTYDELCTLVEFGGYCTADIASVGKLKHMDTDGPNVLDGTHRWCAESLIGSTWNTELAYREGVMMGTLGLLHGVQGWYAPGADMHRSPFSGRNNEYYSQDGIQGGYIAASVIQGVQSKGVVCYIKHCFMNDQETDRGNLFTWATEQSIREIYAKEFQMALQEGDSKASMTGYGRLAGFSNTGNYNMGTELYQNQWGTQAYFVTDGYIGWRTRTDPDIMVRTGNQMELYTDPFVEYLSGEWDAEKQTVMVGPNMDIESPTQWYNVRMAAKGILFQISDMAAQFNGYSELAVTGGPLEDATQGVDYEASVGISMLLDPDSTVRMTVDGMLPMGLEIDANTGAISGTPKQAGSAMINVKYVIDGYIEKSATYMLNVLPAFSMDKDGDALDALQVGKEFMNRIVSEEFTTEKYNSVKYALKSGVLPAGVTLAEDGLISGTPTEAGIFPITVEMTAESESSSGGKGKSSSSTSTTTLDYDLTLTVKGDDGQTPEPPKTDYEENVPYIGANGNWFVNGKDLGVKAQGAAGKDGANGTNGTNGTNGADGKNASSALGVIGLIAGLAGLGTGALALTQGKKKKEEA